jgi:transposase
MIAAIDIHKSVFEAVWLDQESGETGERRFGASREGLGVWVDSHGGRLVRVVVEATTGWRWVARELQARGVEVVLADPGEAWARRGRKKRAKTDRHDARWLLSLLVAGMLPEAWLPPEEIQRLRDLSRLRKRLTNDRTRWAQSLHSLLQHEGWPCQRARLLTASGRRCLGGLCLPEHARGQVDAILAVIGALEAQLEPLERELGRLARADERLRALQSIFGVGPLVACHLLAEIGEAARFSRARQLVRLAGLDPVVEDSGDSRRRGRLAKAGSPFLRWALVEAAQHARRQGSPDHARWAKLATRIGKKRANLVIARTLAGRAWITLRELERDPGPSEAACEAKAA